MHRPFILIPSYNAGTALLRTVNDTLAHCKAPVWVVIDGSDDGSDQPLSELSETESRLRVIVKPVNEGKGAAVRSGLEVAVNEGYTHALVMDSDGQHPSEAIERFLEISRKEPQAVILGQPLFDANVPKERLYGRKLSVWLVHFETLSRQVADPLFGFRIYPIAPLMRILSNTRRSNRYDFDPEVVVRLVWQGVPVKNVPAPVFYPSKEHGGVSHFHYLRDNLRFIVLHVKLLLESPLHWFRKPKPKQATSFERRTHP